MLASHRLGGCASFKVEHFLACHLKHALMLWINQHLDVTSLIITFFVCFFFCFFGLFVFLLVFFFFFFFLHDRHFSAHWNFKPLKCIWSSAGLYQLWTLFFHTWRNKWQGGAPVRPGTTAPMSVLTDCLYVFVHVLQKGLSWAWPYNYRFNNRELITSGPKSHIVVN